MVYRVGDVCPSAATGLPDVGGRRHESRRVGAHQQATQQGRVIRTEEFQREIEALLGRQLGDGVRGHPRKERLVNQK
jgi:hypothetical protein